MRARVYNGSFADPSRVLGLSVPSVFSVLKAFEFLRDSHAVKSFNTENTEGTEKRIRRGGTTRVPSD